MVEHPGGRARRSLGNRCSPPTSAQGMGELIGGVTGGELGESFGQPGVRIDAVELAVFDERGDHRPVVAAFVGAGEQGILAIEGDGPDARSTVLVSISMRPSSRKRVSPSQRVSA